VFSCYDLVAPATLRASLATSLRIHTPLSLFNIKTTSRTSTAFRARMHPPGVPPSGQSRLTNHLCNHRLTSNLPHGISLWTRFLAEKAIHQCRLPRTTISSENPGPLAPSRGLLKLAPTNITANRCAPRLTCLPSSQDCRCGRVPWRCTRGSPVVVDLRTRAGGWQTLAYILPPPLFSAWSQPQLKNTSHIWLVVCFKSRKGVNNHVTSNPTIKHRKRSILTSR